MLVKRLISMCLHSKVNYDVITLLQMLVIFFTLFVVLECQSEESFLQTKI